MTDHHQHDPAYAVRAEDENLADGYCDETLNLEEIRDGSIAAEREMGPKLRLPLPERRREVDFRGFRTFR